MRHRRIPVSDESGDAREARAAKARPGPTPDPESPSPSAGRDGWREGLEDREGDGERGDGGAATAESPRTARERRADREDQEGGEGRGEPREGVESGGEAILRDQLVRLAAEFDNFRKRESRERAETWGRAKADLIEKLLPALDDLRRVAHPEGADASAFSALRGLLEGVELVERKLFQTLEREGLAPIESENAVFDPAVHEAILTQPTDRPEQDGRVAQVALPGYRFGERLLRPAKVVVWKLPR